MKRFLAAGLLMLTLSLGGCVGTTPETPGGETPPKAQQLYPVWKLTPQGKQWGYMDAAGKVVIGYQYESAAAFTDAGTAVVGLEGKKALISAKGLVLDPVYDSLSVYPGGRTVGLRDGSWSELLDSAGKAVYETGLSIQPMAEGGARIQEYVADRIQEGYIDDAGKVTVEPQYLQAFDFMGGRAVVKTAEGAFSIIDTEGKPLVDFEAAAVSAPAESTFAYQKPGKQPGLWGYRDMTGKVTIPAAYAEAGPFDKGLAVVGERQKGIVRYGLIDAKGKYILRPKYGRIEALGNGFFAISRQPEQQSEAINQLYAVFNSDGKRLTDYSYYEVAACTMDTVSVSDGTETWVIDSAGTPMSTMPRLSGMGTVREAGDLLVSQVDDERAYFTRQGELVWQSPSEAVLKDALKLKRLKYRPDRGTVIYYPALEGQGDATVQALINDSLRQSFLGAGSDAAGNGDLTETVRGDYAVQMNKDLLIVDRRETRVTLSDGTTQEVAERYHIDLKTGVRYGLQDLFRPESGWQPLLAEQVQLQLAKRETEGAAITVGPVLENRPFLASRYGLVLYYDSGELGEAPGKQVTFDIPYVNILKAISTEGPMWNAFLKQDM